MRSIPSHREKKRRLSGRAAAVAADAYRSPTNRSPARRCIKAPLARAATVDSASIERETGPLLREPLESPVVCTLRREAAIQSGGAGFGGCAQRFV